MKTICSEWGYQSNLTFLGGICPDCKNDNSVNDYQNGDKFKVVIEGSEHYFRYVDDVIDQVQCDTHFEVDTQVLRADLKHLNKHDIVELRHDCTILKIS